MGRFAKLEFGHFDDDLGPKDEKPAPDACFLQAEREYREGNFENALRYYSRALEGDRLMIEAWRRQVQMLIELGELREATLWADKAMELFPKDSDLLAAKVIGLCRMGDSATAFKVADQAIRLPTVGPYPWIARGEVLLFRREGHHDHCFSKAIAMSPGGWQTFALIGRSYQFHGLYSKALEHFNRALAAEPGIVFMMIQAAYCQMELGLGAHAKRMLEEVLRVNPRHVAAREALKSVQGSSLGNRIRGFFRRARGK